MAEEAVLQQGLAGLTRTMSMHMDKINKSNVSFREVAAQNNKSLSNVIKDVFGAVSGQRKELSEVNDNLEESFSGIRQGFQNNTRATESLNDGIQQVLSVQYKTLGELSQLNRNMSFLINNTSGGVLGQVFGGALTNIFGPGFSLLTGALRTILPLGVAGGAAYMAGQTGVGGGALGPGVGETGSSSEAMSFFQSKGWTREQSAGIVGNLQVESTKNLKTNAVGDGGQAYGIAQWHPDRQARFEQVIGIPIRQSTFKQQLEFVDWELKNSEAKAGNILRSAKSAEEAAALLDEYYERSKGIHRNERMANARALVQGKGQASPTTPASSSAVNITTPGSSTTTTNVTNNTTSVNEPADPGRIKPEAPGVTGPAEKQGGMLGVSLPQNDIVALGHALEKMGMRISEHPDFGGVKPVHKGKAHYEGRAIDINFGNGVVEANDPALGSKFDQLADKLTKLGYKVYWRNSGPYGAEGHDNHLHAELPKSGSPSVPDKYQIAGTAEQRAMQGATPVTGAALSETPTGATGAQAAAPQSTEYRPENFMQRANEQLRSEAETVSKIMGGMSGFGMGGMMFPGIPGISSIASEAASMMQPTPQAAQQIQQPPELTRMIETAAVEDKVLQSMQVKPPEMESRETEPSQFMQSVDRHFPQGSYSDYNTDNHLYPEWASMLFDVYGRFTGSKGGNIKTSLA